MLLTSLGFLLHLVSSAVAVEVDAAVFSRQAFDYIVVGGGTTGLAVAMRYVSAFCYYHDPHPFLASPMTQA